jgi:two-component system response regulator AtoC
MKLGAYDYISKPFKSDEILLTIKKAEERENLKNENLRLREEVRREYSFENIITCNNKIKEAFNAIKKLAPYKLSVLITGESGTGKELFAKAIHHNSPRANHPFIALNCGAIPKELLETELFGHAKGAFSGAISSKKGLFEEADKGTIFLDEIGDLPLDLQVKLLRVLQEEEIRKVGENKTFHIDVRVIAATAKDLKKELEKKLFREDIFFRLNGVSIHIPPLRERKEDIPLLVEHFIKKHTVKGEKLKSVSRKFLKQLHNYHWPGNVRELENLMQRSIIMNESGVLTTTDFPPDFNKRETTIVPFKKASRKLEKEIISTALQKTNGNRKEAAEMIGISYRSLMYKMKEYKIL